MSHALLSAEKIHDLFAEHGLRCTRQRKALYEALAATRDHPTADQLHQQVAGEDAEISLATVYNTLDAFCQAGLAQKLVGKGGSARYDATVSNHLHLRDQRTGAVSDVPDDLGAQLLRHIPAEALRRLERELGFKITQVQIELVGRRESPADASRLPSGPGEEPGAVPSSGVASM